MTDPLMTPYEVERKLLELSKEIDEATEDLIEAESAWVASKREMEMALARCRVEIAKQGLEPKYTVQEKADFAMIACEREIIQAEADEIWVKGSKARVNALRTQVDIIRSIGTSVRSSMDMA
jgi:hypothetical protein